MAEHDENRRPASTPRFKVGDRVIICKPGYDEHGATATVAKVIPGADYDPYDADGYAYVPEKAWRHRSGEYDSYPRSALPDRLVAADPRQKGQP